MAVPRLLLRQGVFVLFGPVFRLPAATAMALLASAAAILAALASSSACAAATIAAAKTSVQQGGVGAAHEVCVEQVNDDRWAGAQPPTGHPRLCKRSKANYATTLPPSLISDQRSA
ncbi:unnamed protein product [Polarella glacialis]|uniref:Uncharacterized protein n=1 Tax=Polarella glacialis TaxID=89957 RepID=A0A813EHH1_POLGL|nr:unnamed protein product [Polarella glacialis]CAE8656915.1 unnamed protein product [Polarella glacialis]